METTLSLIFGLAILSAALFAAYVYFRMVFESSDPNENRRLEMARINRVDKQQRF